MTDDDDLTRRLEAWAAATDPDADPITATEVAEAPAITIRRRAARRSILAVAAALLVVLGIGAAVVVTTGDDDGPAEVVTDTTAPVESAPRNQVVVVAPDLDPAWATIVHRFSLIGPDGEGVTGPLLPGTSLVVDRPLEPGRWDLSLLTYDCTQSAGGACERPNVDGTPEVDVGPVRCDVPLDIGPTPARRIVSVTPNDDRTLRCGLRATDQELQLTAPPTWSVRPELAWSCGNASFDAEVNPLLDPPAKAETFACFQDAVERGTEVEIPVTMVAGDGLGRAWWRVLPEPVDGGRFEILRERATDGARGWVRTLCQGVAIEHGGDDMVSEDGDYVGYQSIWGEPTDCTDEEPLPLDLPPLDEAEPALPTTTSPTTTTPATTPASTPTPGSVTVDVVLDLQPPAIGEAEIQWWALTLADGRMVHDLAGAPIVAGGTRRVALVADDVRVAPADRWSLIWSRATCNEGRCPAHGPDGRPRDGRTYSTSCTNDLPTDLAGGTVLVVTLVDHTCSTAVADAIPDLTIPPAVSLLPPLVTPCGAPGTLGVDDVGEASTATTSAARRCFVEAVIAGDVLEMRSPTWIDDDAPDGRTWRHEDGTVTVFGHGDPVTGEGWTVRTCGSMVEVSEVPFMEPTSCGPAEPLPLTP